MTILKMMMIDYKNYHIKVIVSTHPVNDLNALSGEQFSPLEPPMNTVPESVSVDVEISSRRS